jgi:hypothetical protein
MERWLVQPTRQQPPLLVLTAQAMVDQFGDDCIVSVRESMMALAMSARIVFADAHPGGVDGEEQ